MHYDSVQVRAKALKDAEAALVQKRHGPPASMTEVETVVDAVLALAKAVPTPTDRQVAAIAQHIQRARERYGLEVPPWRDAYPWTTTWAEETRPGRGHDLTTVWMDGEHVVVLYVDVYGLGHGLSVGDVEWQHYDGAEDCPCRYCVGERTA